MKSLSLLHYADRRLKQNANDVAQFDDNLKSLVAAMMEAMHRLHLISICAPQVGIPERILIIPDQKAQPLIMINSQIVQGEDEAFAEEESNIFPHIAFNTSRKKDITVAYNDIHGAVHEQHFTDNAAILIQQHLDHFKGKLLVDFMSALKKERFLKQYDKMIAEGACHHGCSH